MGGWREFQVHVTHVFVWGLYFLQNCKESPSFCMPMSDILTLIRLCYQDDFRARERERE